MKIEILGRNYVVSEKLTGIIEKKLGRMNRYFGGEARAEVICRKQGRVEKMEITISNAGQTFRGEVTTSNMFTNIDIILPKIERQLLKHKDKLQTRLRKEAYEDKKTLFHFITPKVAQTDIVKYKHFDVDPISHAEAAMQLDTTDHDFYIYSNAANKKLCVIYKRKDGNFGVIEIGNSEMKATSKKLTGKARREKSAASD